MYTQSLTVLLHILWCWLFVHMLKWGYVGVILATNITYILNMVLTELCIRRKQDSVMQNMIVPLDHSCYTNLNSYLQEGLPAMILSCFEWWIWEILAIFTGLLGVDQLAADIIFSKLSGFLFMIPLGIGFAASSMVGNSLGQGRIELAKRYADAALLLSTFLMTIIVYFLHEFPDWVTTFFTRNESVSKVMKNLLWLILAHLWVN